MIVSMLHASAPSSVPSQTASPLLPRISPEEYQTIEGCLDAVLEMFQQNALFLMREAFHQRITALELPVLMSGSASLITASISRLDYILNTLRGGAIRLKNPFLARFLDHDIMSPLLTLASYFSLLRELQDDQALCDELIQLYSGLQDAEWFIRSFKESMQFWVDPSLAVPKKTSLEPLIQHAIFCAVRNARSTPIVHLPHEFDVHVHGGVLGVLLVNIFKNALQRGSAQLVDVSSERVGDRVLLSISDDGVGVPDAMASKIFELGVSTAGSTGIGLGAAREKLASIGATIRCIGHGGLPSSSVPGQFGARFVIDMAAA